MQEDLIEIFIILCSVFIFLIWIGGNMIAQFRCPACGTALHISSVAEANAPAGFQTRIDLSSVVKTGGPIDNSNSNTKRGESECGHHD